MTRCVLIGLFAIVSCIAAPKPVCCDQLADTKAALEKARLQIAELKQKRDKTQLENSEMEVALKKLEREMHELKKEQDNHVEKQPTDEAKLQAKVELYERRLAAKDAGQSVLKREILDLKREVAVHKTQLERVVKDSVLLRKELSRVLDVLSTSLTNRSPAVRIWGSYHISYMQAMGDGRRLRLLKDLTEDSDPAVRDEATKAIDRIEAEKRTTAE